MSPEARFVACGVSQAAYRLEDRLSRKAAQLQRLEESVVLLSRYVNSKMAARQKCDRKRPSRRIHRVAATT